MRTLTNMSEMDTVVVDGITLAYRVSGSGEPAIFVHGALFADSFRPLLDEPALADRYRLVMYHRRGYGNSSHGDGPISIAQQAADCRAVLHHLGIDCANVVGESLGGCIALQLALDTPESVHTLALLEPALAVGESGRFYRDSLVQGRQQYREGDPERVVDDLLRARMGQGYRRRLDRVLPGAVEQAVVDAATPFERELPGWLDWSFGEAEAKRITQPVLAVTGSESSALWARFGEAHRLLLEWFPDVRGFVLPGASHGLHLDNPRGMADALAEFWARHPVPGRISS
jgi:pimeloyl-ACP methyl ester carboxylesterase